MKVEHNGKQTRAFKYNSLEEIVFVKLNSFKNNTRKCYFICFIC